MSRSEMTRSELVRAMVHVATLLTGPKSLEDRIVGLIAGAATVLRCDQVAIMQIEGSTHYRGAFQHGLGPVHGPFFREYIVSREKTIVKQIESCKTYLLFNAAHDDPTLRRIATMMGVTSVIIVPFTHPDGSPFGYLTASYVTDKRTITAEEAELAMGVARLAQTTMLRELEVERRREVSQAMLQVADSERRRLSRDIHDDPLQRILGLRIGLEGFREQLSDPALHATVDSFIDQCRSASASLREVMLRTHPNAAELADLEEVLRSIVERGDLGVSVQLAFSDERSEESPSYLVPALNRIAEQAARNTLRHAGASMLAVRLTDKNGGTLLTIQDDGRGFDPSVVDQTRLGLVSMRERTELLGGTFSIDSVPGSGTIVSAWFPHTDVDHAELDHAELDQD